MPLYDEMYYDQKWSLWDTWDSIIGRELRVAVVTAQHRLINVVTAHHRLLNVIAAQYRSIRIRLGG